MPDRGPRRHNRRIGLIAVIALVAALAPAATAWGAKVVYPSQTAQFGADGTDSTTFGGTSQMTFNQASHRLYALGNSGGTKIFGFDVSTPGTYTPLGAGDGFPISVASPGIPGLSTDNSPGSAGNIYYVSENSGSLYGFTSAGVGLSGFPVSGFGDPCGGATDGEGNTWVGDYGAQRIKEYSSAGASLGSVDVSRTGSPCAVGIDGGNDDLYVLNYGGGVYLYKHTASGYASGVLFSSQNARAIAIDPVTHIVFLAHGNDVSEYTPDGTLIDTFAEGIFPGGVAEDPDTHTVYVSGNEKIRVFVPVITPDAISEPPTDVTDTSVTLAGHVDPAGGGEITDCHFEWGPATGGFPNQLPCTPAAPLSSATDVSAEVTGLVPGTGYHYRLIATNANGTTTGSGVSFQTPAAPTVDGAYSSDLTPTTAVLHAAINPQGGDTTYHFEYGTTTAYGSSIPIPDEDIGAGYEDEKVEAQLTDLEEGFVYHFRVVATNQYGTTVSDDQSFNFFPPTCPNGLVRQQTGSQYLPDCRAYELVSPGNTGNVLLTEAPWAPNPYASNPTRFAYGGFLGGITGTEPNNSLTVDTYVASRSSTGWHTSYVGIPGNETTGNFTRVASLDLGRFLSFNEPGGFEGVAQPPDNIPYVWSYENEFLGRWPATWALIPGAAATEGSFQPSPDFSHLAFSSNNVAFAPNGIVQAPGSAYDYDTESGATSLISRTESGDDIAQEPGNTSSTEEFILFPGVNALSGGSASFNPGVSTDGSHILMSTSSEPYGFFTNPLPPTRLYMRVDDAITYEVSRGTDVVYVGMTADGSRVFFTSPEQLTEDDTDSSVDLYMWSDDDQLTLISEDSGGSGEGEVTPVIGEANTDSPIASSSGEIYFFSTDQLDGGKGLTGANNLYVYREGAPHFVTTFFGSSPIGRIQISPDGGHVAFLTASKVTAYDNAGYQEMYSYNPANGRILCVSCQPDGTAPTADVRASTAGFFMSDDGRTFFSTTDALVPQDTNALTDIYEFVEGRPQLISTGTAAQDSRGENENYMAGLAGVSADGVDVYFSTYDSLVPEDHNGPFLKFYDARTNGGFLFDLPAAPCEAADECHGEDSSRPVAPPVVSDDRLGEGGNMPGEVVPKRHGRKHRRSHRHRKHRRHGKRHHRARDGAGRIRHRSVGGRQHG
jgi:hypothetical protein